MSVDKFGRHLQKTGTPGARGPPGAGFELTSDGDFNIGGKRLKNVSTPETVHDAATKGYVIGLQDENINKFNGIISDIKENINSFNTSLQTMMEEIKHLLSRHMTDYEQRKLFWNAEIKAIKLRNHKFDSRLEAAELQLKEVNAVNVAINSRIETVEEKLKEVNAVYVANTKQIKSLESEIRWLEDVVLQNVPPNQIGKKPETD